MAAKKFACFAVLLWLVVATCVLAQNDDDNDDDMDDDDGRGSATPTGCRSQIRQAALDNNLNMFAWGLDQVDLNDYDVDDGKLTLFGPVDDGFDSSFMSNLKVAKEIVKYHVVRGYFELEDLVDGQELETVLLGKSSCAVDKLVVKKDGSGTFVTGAGIEAKIATADLLICGSVIHTVDKLLVPCPARLAAVAADEDDDDGLGDDDDGTADNDDDDGDDGIDDDNDDNDNDDDGLQMATPVRVDAAIASDDGDDDGADNDDN